MACVHHRLPRLSKTVLGLSHCQLHKKFFANFLSSVTTGLARPVASDPSGVRDWKIHFDLSPEVCKGRPYNYILLTLPPERAISANSLALASPFQKLKHSNNFLKL